MVGVQKDSRHSSKSSPPCRGFNIQLFGMIILASSGVIISASVFHWRDASRQIAESINGNLPFQEMLDRSRQSLPKKAIERQTAVPPNDNGDLLRQEEPKESQEDERLKEPIESPQSLVNSGTSSNAEEPAIAKPPIEQESVSDIATAPTLEQCLALNSKNWTEGKRVGNTQQGHITFDIAMRMILNTPPLLESNGEGSMHALLKQTICHEQSRFLNYTDDGTEGQKSIDFWAVRLMYLSIHWHQHKEAIEEARLRQKLGCDNVLTEAGFGTFDYECPDAKFLVVPMGETGLGAVMRLGAVNALFAGMATNRTVLLVNNVEEGHNSLHRPWVHSSCERGDIQCFFMPPTPCTVTHEELAAAHVTERGEARRIFKFGEMPPGHEDDRVIVSNFVLRPKAVPPTLLPAMLRIVDEIIDHIRIAIGDQDPRIQVMEKSKEVIGDETPFDKEKGYYYSGVESKIHHAAVFYAMRPNPFNAEKLDNILSKEVPADFNPELSFGLPVRASDKCLRESECLAFPQYMKLMGQIWNTHQDTVQKAADFHGVSNLTTSIVLTTESPSVLEDKKRFEEDHALRSQVPFNYRFVTNDHDVMQSTGDPGKFMKHTEDHVKEDDIMLSAISSLKLQLMAKFTVGNCCSNFHLLLFDFLQDGCGAAKDNIGQCLQENEEAEFRVCCMWSKSDECVQKSEAKRAAEAAAKEMQ